MEGRERVREGKGGRERGREGKGGMITKRGGIDCKHLT